MRSNVKLKDLDKDLSFAKKALGDRVQMRTLTTEVTLQLKTLNEITEGIGSVPSLREAMQGGCGFQVSSSDSHHPASISGCQPAHESGQAEGGMVDVSLEHAPATGDLLLVL